jgi:hypothetical protein
MSIAAVRRATSFDHAIAPILPVLLVAAGAACFAGLVRAALILPLHVPLDPDEGWNAYHAAAAIVGRGPYLGSSSFMSNNYPPLSFYIVGILGTAIGDQIVAGRIVSLISFLCVCGFVVLAIRRMNAGWQSAWFAVLFLAAFLLMTSDYVGMDDPQLLGHVFDLGGLLLVLGEPRRSRVLFAGSVLFVAGGFVKHNLFVLPLATVLWLALSDRRSALRLAVSAVLLSILGLVACRFVFGPDLLGRLASPRLWSLAGVGNILEAWLPYAAIPLCAIAGLAVPSPRDRAVRFVAIYAALAVLAGMILSGGAGVDVNAMFDADIALAIGAGLAVDRLLRQRHAILHIPGRALALASFLPFVFLASENPDWHEGSFWLRPMQDETSLSIQDISFLRAHPGPAICETLAFCYWAGKSASVDVFNLDQQFRTGARNPAPFLRLLDRRYFSAIELDEMTPFPLPEAAKRAILHNYLVDHADDEGVFFVPR